MKLAVLDIETSNLLRCDAQILEVVVMIEDSEVQAPRDQLPTLRLLCPLDLNASWSDYTRKLHESLVAEIQSAPDGTLTLECDIPDAIDAFTFEHGCGDKPFFCGKNVGMFDLPFIQECAGKLPRHHHRILDPGSLYWHPTDTEIPSLATCLDRAGLDSSGSHTAAGDSWDVIRVIRAFFGGRNI